MNTIFGETQLKPPNQVGNHEFFDHSSEISTNINPPIATCQALSQRDTFAAEFSAVQNEKMQLKESSH